MKKYFFLAAAAPMLLSACSNDELEKDSPIPLTIGYSLGEMNSPSVNTRANANDIQSTELLNDATNSLVNAVGIFVLKEGEKTHTTTEQYERFNVTSTTLSTSPATGYTAIGVATADALYYPENKTQKIDIYAYAPFTVSTVSDITTAFSIDTETDQTTKEKYMKSDVLWGCAGTGTYVEKSAYDGTTAGQTPEGPYHKLGKAANFNEVSASKYMEIKKNETAGTPPTATHTTDGQYGAYYLKYDNPDNTANTATAVVPMLHRGSKIVINLLPGGMAKDKLKNAVVKFNVDYIAGSLNMSTGKYAVTTGTTAAVTPITLTSHLGIDAQGTSPNAEGVATVTTSNDAFTCSAVIVPQTITTANNSGNGNIITIDLKSDLTSSATTTATYAYKTGSTTAPTFESGKVYTYNITVLATGLTVTTTVSDWVAGTGGGSFNAVLQ